MFGLVRDTKQRGAFCMIRVAILRAIVVLSAILVTTVAGVQAQVRVDIGIHLPAPPAFVVIPGMPVYYAPQTPENVFFYGHHYWAFQGGGWYFGQSWNGPWAVVEPARVPAPILQVPVRYYRVPPAGWKPWRRDAPPRWEEHYGREWREEAHERDWREREDRWARHEGKGCPPGLAKQGRC
jgi:hypothetical protein